MDHILVETLIMGKKKFFLFYPVSVCSHLATCWLEGVYVTFSASVSIKQRQMRSLPEY